MATTQDSTTNPTANQRPGSSVRPTTLGEQTSKVAEDVRELGHIALSGAGDAIQAVKERGSEMLEKGKAKAEDARAGFEGYVAENPFKTVLIAAGIGALIGYSLRRRD